MAAAYASASNVSPHKSAAHHAAGSTSNAPQGTFLSGTKVQVGSHRVVIDRYLSEGGFAHVYVVRIPRDGSKYELAVLKRVAVPDKDHLASMRTEVETMKKLKGHKHIVTYIDSHASQLKGGGYEVFLLMEFCQGGGLIDFMNTRLQHRLVEPEILKIFGDAAEGLACMHYLKPPLLHRDLKVENVLISKSGSAPVYKLADFGSTAPPRPAATTAEEGRLIEDDVQKHTTMQYRSPEMIDVWRKRPIDEKSDIWAMGVFLYKLCYYTTPFEEVGQMAILNASFKYPAYPQFSDRLLRLIGSMLREDPSHRPNIYQVLKEVSSMRGTEVPIKDIYSDRSQSESRRNEVLPSTKSGTASSLTIGLQRGPALSERPAMPDIVPMRRGRPGAAAQPTAAAAAAAAKPNPSPSRGDPFAALDSKNIEVRADAGDELANRFPSLGDFAIAHDRSEAFQFTPKSVQADADQTPMNNLSERVTNALADEAFAALKQKVKIPSTKQTTKSDVAASTTSVTQRAQVYEHSLPIITSPSGNRYVSTATGSSPPRLGRSKPTSQAEIKLPPELKSKPVWRIPSSHSRSPSQPRASPETQAVAASLQPSLPPTQTPALLEMHRSKSQTATVAAYHDADPSADTEDHTLLRAQTVQARSRPTSAYLSSNLDFLREQEVSRKSSYDLKRGMDSDRRSREPSPRPGTLDEGELAVAEASIDNDIEFLHSKDDDGLELKVKNSRKASERLSFVHKKRNSLPSITGATKEIFKGRFGDAFKRFEPANKDDLSKTPPTAEPKTPNAEEQDTASLSPIQGSDATPSKHSDDDAFSDIGDAQDLSKDVKREMERRRLSQEERRVAEAAREYRERVAVNGTGVQRVSRGTAIQMRVQSLLDEGSRSSSPVKRTADGYGHFTDAHESDESQSLPPRTSSLNKSLPPIVAKKPEASPGLANPRTRPAQATLDASSPRPLPPPEPVSTAQIQRSISRPSAPAKPQVLRKSQWPPLDAPNSSEKTLPPQPAGNLAALLAKDLEGVPDYPSHDLRPTNTTTSAQTQEDLEAEFSRRYPSLSGIEMVERDLGTSHGARSKEI